MLRSFLARGRSLWRGARARPAVDAEMDEEFRLHMELRAADLVQRGLAPEAAARQARVEFGSVDHYKDRGVESRGLRRFDDVRLSLLDFTLGARMLAKYPGLTIVGGIAIAFAVAVGTGTFELLSQYAFPALPVPDAHRVVVVSVVDPSTARVARRIGANVTWWRREARTLEDVSGVSTLDQNMLTTHGDPGSPVPAARMQASAFRLTGAQPLIGRALTEADEAIGAPEVALIGYDVWQERFAGDSNVVGQRVHIGRTTHTIVGVMPKAFTFPDHRELWLPLRLDAAVDDDPGPPLRYVVARLAPGTTIAQAEAELRAIDARHPSRRRTAASGLRTRVQTFAQTTDVGGDGALFAISSNTFLTALLALVFANVALLVLARAATREAELVVRTALGATRARIIMQLFAEALVLSALGAAVGLGVAAAGWRWAMDVLARSDGGHLPFWLHPQLSNSSIAYALLMVLLCAIVTGALPAIKLTGGIEQRLRHAAAGTRGLRFSGIWTVVIVGQIALTIAFPVTMFFAWRDAAQVKALDLGVQGHRYLIAHLSYDADDFRARSRSVMTGERVAPTATMMHALQGRLEQERDVGAVTFATLLPGMDHPQRAIQVEGDSVGPVRVSSVSVAPDFFSTLGKGVIAGRAFQPIDVDTASRALIVNITFVRTVLHGRNPLGRRIRFVAEPSGDEDRSSDERVGPWHTIVGIVGDLGMTDGSDPHETGAGIYQPLIPGASAAPFIAVRTTSDPGTLGPRLRTIAAAIDPTLRVTDIKRLDDVQAQTIDFSMSWFRVLAGVTAIALMLSLASIYSVMAFAVAQRTREIGVRVALGASPRQIVGTIFARPLRQVALGVAFGALLVTTLSRLVLETLTMREAGVITGYAVLMWCVCLAACVVPTRRALGIEPTEALRTE